MKNRFFQVLVLLLFVLILTRVSTAANYIRSGKFRAIKLTYDDISALIKQMDKVIPPPEKPDDWQDNWLDDRQDIRKIVTIGDGELQVQIDLTDEFQLKELGRLPPVSYNFRYLFRCPYGKIEEVSIRFYNSLREVSVTGSDPDQVNALYSYLDTEITKHTILFGGTKFQFVSRAFLMMIGVVLFMLPSLMGFDLSVKQVYLLWCFGILTMVLAISLPLGKWLPSFAVYSESASALVRYSAQIAFWGLLIGLVSVILACIAFIHQGYRLSKKEPQKEATKRSHKRS